MPIRLMGLITEKSVLLDKETDTSAEAHKHNLVYKGHGYWMTPEGDTVAKTVNGKIEWLNLPHDLDKQPSTEEPDALAQTQTPELNILAPTFGATQNIEKIGTLLDSLKEKLSPEVVSRLEHLHHAWFIAGEKFKQELQRSLHRTK